MRRNRAFPRLLSALLIASILVLLVAPTAFAEDVIARPVPVVGPRLKPPPIPHTDVLNPAVIYNAQPKPVQLAEASATYKAQPYYTKGAGIVKSVTQWANGILLYPTATACNDFNGATDWASLQKPPSTDLWTDWYGGWAPFAVDDGFHKAKNTTFSLERSVGPGVYMPKGYSAKIASNQPYAGGFGSPMISVPPRANVTVTVKYLIWDYVQAADPANKIMDWASLGVKPDAESHGAVYVNGYVRGEWAVMETSLVAGPSGYIMVLLQGESAGAVNSNIYFDDVQIKVDDQYLGKCLYE